MINPNELNWVERKVYDWAVEVRNLFNTPVPQNLQAEKNKLLERALKIKTAIEKITGPTPLLEPLGPIQNQLGVIPLVLVGAVAAAVGGYITYWYTDHKKFMEKVNLQKRLEREGKSAEQAAAIVNQNYGPRNFWDKFTPSTKTVIVAGGVGFGIWYLWRNR